MNKQQIICLLVAMVILAAVVAMISSRNHRRHWLQANVTALAHELVTSTNSTHLLETPNSLEDCLARLLTAPAGVEHVLLGDDDSRTSGRRASARVILTNASHQSLTLRLRAESDATKFSVLSFEMADPASEP